MSNPTTNFALPEYLECHAEGGITYTLDGVTHTARPVPARRLQATIRRLAADRSTLIQARDYEPLAYSALIASKHTLAGRLQQLDKANAILKWFQGGDGQRAELEKALGEVKAKLVEIRPLRSAHERATRITGMKRVPPFNDALKQVDFELAAFRDVERGQCRLRFDAAMLDDRLSSALSDSHGEPDLSDAFALKVGRLLFDLEAENLATDTETVAHRLADYLATNRSVDALNASGWGGLAD